MSRVRPREFAGEPKSGKLTAKEKREIAEMRRELAKEVGRCEACGHGPGNPCRILPQNMSVLNIHEIDNGPGRQGCQDKRFGTLCLCAWCNLYQFTDKKLWPVAKQLCLLRASRPFDFHLENFVRLVKGERAPNWITREDVDAHEPEITEIINRRDGCE